MQPSKSVRRGRDDNPKRGIMARLLSGKGLIFSIIFTALVAAITPMAVAYVRDQLSTPVQVTAEEVDFNDRTMVYGDALTPCHVSSRTDADFINDMKSGRATKAGIQLVRLVLHGNRSRTVTITDIRAHILKKSPALHGTLYYAPPQGELEDVAVGVELSRTELSVREVTSAGWSGPYFVGRAYTLKGDEISIFQIEAHATNATYTWNIEVDMVVDGKSQVIFAEGANGPFHLSSLSRSYGAVIEAGSFPRTVEASGEFCPRHIEACQDKPR